MPGFREYISEFDPRRNFRIMGRNAGGDIVGGITSGIVALPLALAFGIASGLGAKAGLYGAIVIGFLAALFGGTPSQISGPTAPMTMVVIAVAAVFAGNQPLVFAVIALSGIFQLAFAFTRTGKYVQYMPYPVISGFLTGLGIIILITQFNPFVGLPGISDVSEALKSVPNSIANLNAPALLIGAVTLVSIYLSPRIFRRIPGTLVGLILGTGLAIALGLQVPNIGEIPTGLPTLFKFPEITWDIFRKMVGPAMALAVLGLLDTLLTSIAVERITRVKHNSNRELMGQGIGNFFAGIFGGLPGAGADIRTLVNIKSGGKTPLSGVTNASFLLAAVLVLGRWLKYIPIPCLAAVLFKAAIDIIDFKAIKSIFRIPKFDAAVMLVVLALTVAVDLMVAVGIGLLLACILFVKRMGDLLNIEIITLNDLDAPWVADERWRARLDYESKKKVLVFQMNGPLFFGASSNFLKSAEKHEDFRILILRMHRVPEIDTTGAMALEELAQLFKEHDKVLLISGLEEGPRAFLEKLGILDLIGRENCFRRFEQAASRSADLLLGSAA